MNRERILELLRDWRVLAGVGAAVVALAAVVVLASGGGEPQAAPPTTTTTSSSSTTTSTSSTTSTTLPLTWPLTGEPVAEGAEGVHRRVLVAKVDNSSSSRPQEGLEQADVIIEVGVEGGITRFLALFQSLDPEVVGPIRSIREVDPKLVAPFDPLVAHSGGVPGVVSRLREVAVDLGHDVLGSAYRRQAGRPAPYDLMLDPRALREAAPSWERQVPRVLAFSDQPPEGEPATEIEIQVSPEQRTVYRYSEVDGGYLRFNGQQPHTDAAGDQLTADTVVVVFAPQIATGRTDVSGSPVPDYEVLGRGEAVLFREGRVVEGTWERGRLEDFFRLFDEQGGEVGLAPGTTWVELVPTGNPVEWS